MERMIQKILRVTAVLIWIVGAIIGYDAAGTTVIIGTQVQQSFNIWDALIVWLAVFAAGMLLWGVAKILDLFEER